MKALTTFLLRYCEGKTLYWLRFSWYKIQFKMDRRNLIDWWYNVLLYKVTSQFVFGIRKCGRQALLSDFGFSIAYTKRLCQKNCYLSVRYWIDLDIEISYTKRILARKTGRYSPFGLVNSSRQLPNGLRRSPRSGSCYDFILLGLLAQHTQRVPMLG